MSWDRIMETWRKIWNVCALRELANFERVLIDIQSDIPVAISVKTWNGLTPTLKTLLSSFVTAN